MPGAFAHLTVADQLTTGTLLGRSDLPTTAKGMLMDNARFVDLGAVSPDYPYLAILDGNQKRWADHMHYDRTGELILRLLSDIQKLTNVERDIALPWCLGYIAHVVTDMTIHPVVELKVGPYEGNEAAHRRCEMFQDVYIFRRLNTGGVGIAEHLSNGIVRSGHPSEDMAHPIIADVWRNALKDVYPDTFAAIGEPDIDAWHNWFVLAVDKIAEEGNTLGFIPLARHVLRGHDLIYPNDDEVDDASNASEFINELVTPEGVMAYDSIFDRALDNVLEAWKVAADYVLSNETESIEMFGSWNLDTGRDENGSLVYWNP